MKKSSTTFAVSYRRGVFGLLLVAFAATAISIAPFVNHARAEQTQKLTEHATTNRDAKITYPESKKVEVVEDFFGTKVVDPYRWLEDETSPEVKACGMMTLAREQRAPAHLTALAQPERMHRALRKLSLCGCRYSCLRDHTKAHHS